MFSNALKGSEIVGTLPRLLGSTVQLWLPYKRRKSRRG